MRRLLEVSRTPRSNRRLHGKDDRLDAVETARAALAAERLALPRGGGRREALRLLLIARRSAIDVRRQALVQLRAVIVTAPDELRRELRALPTGALLERCSHLRRAALAQPTRSRPGSSCAASPGASRRRPAKPTSSSARSSPTCARSRPRYSRSAGVGPIVAAQLIVSWSHHGRIRSEAAFARLAGVAPIPASSGQTQRHRLSPRRRPPTQPRPAHNCSPPPPARPDDPRLHREQDRRGQEPPRRHPATEALPRPQPLPPPRKPGDAHGLTSHRSIIPEHWRKRPFMRMGGEAE